MNSFKKAICREIPKSIVDNGLRIEQNAIPLDYELAVKQHQEYIKALKYAGLEILVLPADELLPDCVFVEDAAVVIGNTVVITNPGAESRKQETILMGEVFRKENNMNVTNMEAPAILDGGDVLFTGREVFIGLSKRTNKQGVETLRNAFPNFPVHGIEIGDLSLHLKSLMSMVCENTISCVDSVQAREVIKNITEKSKFHYDVIYVPDQYAANCVLVNGKLLCHTRKRFPDSIKKYDNLSVELLELNTTELEKVDGAFTCCSILY